MYCKFICVFALLIIGALATNYKARNCDNFSNKKTHGNKYEMSVLFKPERICWYARGFNNGYSKPGCCFQNGRVEAYDMMGLDGEKWDQCINIKKGTQVTDVLLRPDEPACQQLNHTLKKNVINVRAKCNDNGCLTRYGWVTKYSNRRKC